MQLVRLLSGGRNALDFTLVSYVGRAVAADPAGHFHIISKDTGYDPLIEHLQSRNIHAQRHNDFTTLPFTLRPGNRFSDLPSVNKKVRVKIQASIFSLAPQET